MKRRLTMTESTRPKIVTPVKPMATRSKVGGSSRRTSFRDQADLQDIFASAKDESEGEDKEPLSAPETKRARRASNPSTLRPALFTDTIRAAQTHVRTIKKQDIGSSNSLKRQLEERQTTSEPKGPAKSVEKQSIRTSSTTAGPHLSSAISPSEPQHQSESIGKHNNRHSITSSGRDARSGQKMVRPEVAPSSVRKSSSTSTAVHILQSLSYPHKDRPQTGGQAIRSKAVQAYGATKASSDLTTNKKSIDQAAGPSARPIPRAQAALSKPTPPVLAKPTASASQYPRPSLPTGRSQLPTQSVRPTQLPTKAVTPTELPPRQVTPPTSPTTRALVGFIGPKVAALRATREAETVHGDSPLEDTSVEHTTLETLEEPEIRTPPINHVDPNVPPLKSLDSRLAPRGLNPEREMSPELGSESSYYDRSLYGSSPPPYLPGAKSSANAIQSVNGSHSANDGQSAGGGQSVNGVQSVTGGRSNYGARSVYEDLDPDELDDEEFELLVYGERTEWRTEAEGDELIPMEESSDAEAMDICSEDGDSGPTRTGGPAHGDPVQQWRADVF
jgi:hypothetical protein